ncbi:MAG TPA: NADH-quinone oxidoreductase subunit NuoE [Syntrophothermus lipocalidus]|uniref:NADH dehydrogenase (Ubiquinone) 24 kDa subunit n=1 Tax=Syntrophothermus lipocalidus (strain DSM 12680 / TGB-C1) TaxID=643648 RepID=D7CIQ8_SYNLT|nr:MULTISPECIES: NADH-quinone oxidoreductase subunit NuoE [Syntrophothermus]ADI00923.1 NADH dehydrogenase (ubiquinone) 24 kDa subunit [Syntrophothermus lipocalidus DSM 12680]NSW82950.1 NADH-quinone oxidoreductase subunit NuoE [Syntrophothermus sp.]HHV77253.1 NADH-quinone oxidoreductase subunit NuoE [Syntrophothermus lipocalidus]
MVDYKAIIAKYKDLPGGIIEAYHAIQKEQSFIPEEAIIAAAEAFNIPVKDAYGVATFYSMFSVKTRGKNVIRICESAPCHIAGAAQVVAALEKELGIKMGETTPDGKFTLEFTECVGQCQATPVITINGKPYGDITPEKIPAILAEYK